MLFKTKKSMLLEMHTVAIADIIFLLLIFFLLSSSFILQTGIKVNLPSAVLPELEERREVIITLTKEGDIYLKDIKVSLDELLNLLVIELNKTTEKVAIIKGDKAVSLGRTVEVMDIARRAGAERLAIAAELKMTEQK